MPININEDETDERIKEALEEIIHQEIIREEQEVMVSDADAENDNDNVMVNVEQIVNETQQDQQEDETDERIKEEVMVSDADAENDINDNVIKEDLEEQIVNVVAAAEHEFEEQIKENLEEIIQQIIIEQEQPVCSHYDHSPLVSEIVTEDEDEEERGGGEETARSTLNDDMTMPHRRVDIEAGSHHKNKGNWRDTLKLAFLCIGVVFGDLGTSPMYVFATTFSDGGIKHPDDVLGVLSLIFYAITLIPVIKYVLVVLHANDNGEGGTFALYTNLCRHAKVGVIHTDQPEDHDQLQNNSTISKLQRFLEQSRLARLALLFFALLGTSMVVGDGILTPSISVLSAVSGLKEAAHFMTQGWIAVISVVILIALFLVQRLGTGKVGYLFAPIISIWLSLIAGIGAYNFIRYDPSVARAINPVYIIDYFRRNGKDAWVSLGGVVLAITGTEAMFADLGHFTVRSIQISMGCVVYPAIVTAYLGQASWLRTHGDDVADTFYKSIPGALFWPVFVMAVMAAIIASQAMISGTFSIIHQFITLGCFPQLNVVHTSESHPGQVYIPVVNYILMTGCIVVTAAFRSAEGIGSAYGIAVIFAETLTSVFMVVIMMVVWRTNTALVILYVLVICTTEYVFLSAVMYKFPEGGYLPFTFALVFMIAMCAFMYTRHRRHRH